MKHSMFQNTFQDYAQRIRHWSIQIIELDDKGMHTLKIDKNELWIALDERGVSWNSVEFYHHLMHWIEGPAVPCFIIGASDGLSQSILQSCSIILSFSAMTWPHLMARVLLIEQIYRAQQRLLNHPYSFV